MLIVLLLLTYAEKDEEFKKRLLKVLAFYRENRALLTAFGVPAEDKNGAEKGAEKSAEKNGPAQNKNSPPCGGENLRILEEFLKNA